MGRQLVAILKKMLSDKGEVEPAWHMLRTVVFGLLAATRKPLPGGTAAAAAGLPPVGGGAGAALDAAAATPAPSQGHGGAGGGGP